MLLSERFWKGENAFTMKKLILYGSVLSILLATCSTIPTPYIEPVTSVIPSPVPTETKQPPTLTVTPTVMTTPSSTNTPEKIHNTGPSEDQINNIFIDVNINFPEALSSTYEDENFTFDFRISKSLVRYSGIKQFKMPEEMAKRWAYQALWEVFYGLSGKNPAFKDFKTLAVGGSFLQDKVAVAVDDGILNNDICEPTTHG